MSKADEMFIKLGYELKDEKICPHSFLVCKKIKFNIKEIIIEKATKRVTICYYHEETDGTITCINSIEYTLDLLELEAINEKVKELK